MGGTLTTYASELLWRIFLLLLQDSLCTAAAHQKIVESKLKEAQDCMQFVKQHSNAQSNDIDQDINKVTKVITEWNKFITRRMGEWGNDVEKSEELNQAII